MSTKFKLVMVPGFEKVLEREAGVKAAQRAAAERAAEIAQENAPVESGDYRDGIGVDDDGNLVATDWKSHWIEWGSEHNRAFATLRNAAREVASRVVDVPK